MCLSPVPIWPEGMSKLVIKTLGLQTKQEEAESFIGGKRRIHGMFGIKKGGGMGVVSCDRGSPRRGYSSPAGGDQH